VRVKLDLLLVVDKSRGLCKKTDQSKQDEFVFLIPLNWASNRFDINSNMLKTGCMRDGNGILFFSSFRKRKDTVYSPTSLIK
jgi:hypothetical protein